MSKSRIYPKQVLKVYVTHLEYVALEVTPTIRDCL